MPKAIFVGPKHPSDSTLFLVLSDGTRVARAEAADFSDSDFLAFGQHYVLETVPEVEASPKKSGAQAPDNPRKAVN